MIYKNTYTIGFEDVGLDRRATNRTIMTIMEDIAGLHSESVGFGLSNAEERQKIWVVLDWKVKIYHRPAYGQKVFAQTWSNKTNVACAFRDYELFDEQGGLIAAGTSRWVLIDMKTRKPQRLTSGIVELYECETDKKAFEEGMEKLILTQDMISQTSHSQKYVVLRRDIDANRHMHNLNYLEAAVEILPQEVYEQGEYDNIRITYRKEILYGEDVTGNYVLSDGRHIVYFNDSEGNIRSVVALY
jgi:medium-chain acyl-[acyl-carrier-protein] hydrolase